MATVRLPRHVVAGEATERVWRVVCGQELVKWSRERKSGREEQWNMVNQDGTSLSYDEGRGCHSRASGTATLDARWNTPRDLASAVPDLVPGTGSSNTHVGCDVSADAVGSWAGSGAHVLAETLQWQEG